MLVSMPFLVDDLMDSQNKYYLSRWSTE